MKYRYKCEHCEHEVDLELDPNAPRQKRYTCPECKKKGLCQVFGNAVHVPFQWSQDSFKFDKRDRSNVKYR